MKWFVKCLRHYADFRGRASMPEFWYFVLGLFLVLFLLLAVILGVSSLCTVGATSRRYVVCLVGLPFVMPYLAVMVRRLHDCGRSGWWAGGYLAVSIAGQPLLPQTRRGGMADGCRSGPCHFAGSVSYFLVLLVVPARCAGRK